MPWATRRCAGRRRRSWPASSAVPLAGSAPISARMSVVLPAPLRPISPHISPASRWSEAPRMRTTGPIETLRFAILSMAGAGCRGFELRPADQLLNAGIFQGLARRPVGDHRAVIEGEHAIGVAFHD